MAWIDNGSHYSWDSVGHSWQRTFNKARALSDQYKVFTNVVDMRDGTFEIQTKWPITEKHSTACRCEKCLEL